MELRSQEESHQEYLVNFEIEYIVTFGQSLCMLGDIGELGHWKHLLLEMDWTKGNIWKAKIEIASRVFCYKYVVVDQDDNIIRWEEGYNRIGDLDIAEKQGLFQDGEFSFHDVRKSFN